MPNSVDPDQLASEATEVDLHCLANLLIWIFLL